MQPVITPPTGVTVTTPSLAIGANSGMPGRVPAFSVNTIKDTVDLLLGDNIDAPITCQALLESANTAVIAASNTDGYHTLPPSGEKIHAHLGSGNIPELKASGNIITRAGLVGIKKANPASELDVVGRIQATGDVIVVNGAIGIGTTTPSTKLEIANGGITASGNITTTNNVIANNIKNYYQTVNNHNSTVADSSDSTNQVTDAGCPSTASVWTRYTSWKTSGDDTVNSNANVFSPESYGFQALVAGTYKVTVHMTFQTFKSNQNVVIRLAKYGLNNDVADSNNENPGPLANMYMNSYQNAGKIHSIGCAQITHIMTLAVHDEVSVYTEYVTVRH